MDCIPLVYAAPAQTVVGPRAVLGLGVMCAAKKNLTFSFGASLSDVSKSGFASSTYWPIHLGPNKVQWGLADVSSQPAITFTYRMNE